MNEAGVGAGQAVGMQKGSEMHPAFQVHMLNEQGIAKAQVIAHDFNALLETMASLGIAGRDLAIVTTKLEEACFFAKKGMANRTENQK